MKRKSCLARICSKKGSVLFIVLIVMGVMIILASALYYTVSSGRTKVVMEYSDYQAYETAMNIADILADAVSTDHGVGSLTTLRTKVNTLVKTADATVDPRNSATWNPSGWADGTNYLKTTIDPADIGVGGWGEKADVYIYINSSDNLVIDVTVEYNEKSVTFTKTMNKITINPKEVPFPGFTQSFASSGYSTTASWFYNRGADVDVHYETKNTFFYLGTAGQRAKYFGNVTVTGSLEFSGVHFLAGDSFPGSGSKELSVLGDLVIYGNGNNIINNKGKVRVGGDLIFKPGTQVDIGVSGVVDIHVLGDVYFENNDTTGNFNCNLYVHGDIYGKPMNAIGCAVYCNGAVNVPAGFSNIQAGGWTCPASGATTVHATPNDEEACLLAFGRDDCPDSTAAIISNVCTLTTFAQWGDVTIDPSRDKTIKWGDDTGDDWAQASKANPPSGGGNAVDSANASNTATFGTGKANVFYINEDTNIIGIDDSALPSTTNTCFALVVDTGFNAGPLDASGAPTKKDITVRLSDDGDGDSEFKWYPGGSIPSGVCIAIVLIGDGGLILDVPAGVKYVQQAYTGMMCYNLMSNAPTQEIWDTNCRGAGWIKENQGNDTVLKTLVGRSCLLTTGAGAYNASGTSYEVACTTTEGATEGHKTHVHTDKYDTDTSTNPGFSGTPGTYDDSGWVWDVEFGPAYNCKYCGYLKLANPTPANTTDMIGIYGNTPTKGYAPVCEGEMNLRTNLHTEWNCAYPNDKSGATSKNPDCPINMNIFVVSHEKYEVAFNFEKKVFIAGFVYAPYVTFLYGPFGDVTSGAFMLGGLIVSDYIMDDTNLVVGVKPDNEKVRGLVGGTGSTGGTGNQTWSEIGNNRQ